MSYFLIFLLIAAVWFWLDSARAREIAVGICKAGSERYGLQFLDDSVVLHRISLRWPNEGLRIRRQFRFDFSREGHERRSGYITLVGIRLENLDFGIDIVDLSQPKKTAADNIIPIRRE
ncbi:MAG: DUF3301 domain-containing protein [Chromatiales bacterium]|jgi:hypothetical protein